jgi:hypothetical protein
MKEHIVLKEAKKLVEQKYNQNQFLIENSMINLSAMKNSVNLSYATRSILLNDTTNIFAAAGLSSNKRNLRDSILLAMQD